MAIWDSTIIGVECACGHIVQLNRESYKAPKLISQNYNKHFIEIEDLGNLSIYDKLKSNKKSNINYYKKIISLLIKLQKIKTKRINTFFNSKYKIPIYSKKTTR